MIAHPIPTMTPEEEAQWVADRKAGIRITESPRGVYAGEGTYRAAALALLTDEWQAVREIRMALGCSKFHAYNLLNELVVEGLAECDPGRPGVSVLRYRRAS